MCVCSCVCMRGTILAVIWQQFQMRKWRNVVFHDLERFVFVGDGVTWCGFDGTSYRSACLKSTLADCFNYSFCLSIHSLIKFYPDVNFWHWPRISLSIVVYDGMVFVVEHNCYWFRNVADKGNRALEKTAFTPTYGHTDTQYRTTTALYYSIWNQCNTHMCCVYEHLLFSLASSYTAGFFLIIFFLSLALVRWWSRFVVLFLSYWGFLWFSLTCSWWHLILFNLFALHGIGVGSLVHLTNIKII